MKYFLLLLIIFIFGLYGYKKKLSIINQKKFLEDIYEYVRFYNSNLSVFKNDLIEINKRYLFMQKNKNAKYKNNIIKSDNLYHFNINLIKNNLVNYDNLGLVIDYFESIGNLEFDNEKHKNFELIKCLKFDIKNYNEIIKINGDLWFKIMLAIGTIIAIILW